MRDGDCPYCGEHCITYSIVESLLHTQNCFNIVCQLYFNNSIYRRKHKNLNLESKLQFLSDMYIIDIKIIFV